MSPRSYCEKPFWTGRGALFFFLSILLCATAFGQEIEGIGEIEGAAPEAEEQETEGIGEIGGEAPEAEEQETESIGEIEGAAPEIEEQEAEGIGEIEAEAPEAEEQEAESIGEIEAEAPEIEEQETEGIGEIEGEAPEAEEQETEGIGEIEGEAPEIEEQETEGIGEIEAEAPEIEEQEAEGIGEIEGEAPEAEEQEIEGIGEIEAEAPEAEEQEIEGIGEIEDVAPEAEEQEIEGIGEIEDVAPEIEEQEAEIIGEIEDVAPEAEEQEIEGIGEIEDVAPEIEEQEAEGIGEIEDVAPEIEEQEIEGIGEIEDEVLEIEDIEEMPAEEAGPSWRQWEFGFQTGRIILTGSAFSKDALAHGFYALYRFRGKGMADDGTPVEVQGRHGFELNVAQFKTDYNRTFGLYSGSDALPISFNFGGTKLTMTGGWYGLEVEGEYAYRVVSVNYIYTHLDKRHRLRKVTFYALGGGGYVLGSKDNFKLRGHVRQVEVDPGGSGAFLTTHGTVEEQGGGSGLCAYNDVTKTDPLTDPQDPNYELCTNAKKALSFFDFGFFSTTVVTFGGGVRWQMSPGWVVNFELRDFLMPFDDSGFLATGKKAVGEPGTRSEWTFDKQETDGHSFYIRFSIAYNFQRLFGFIGGGRKKQ